MSVCAETDFLAIIEWLSGEIQSASSGRARSENGNASVDSCFERKQTTTMATALAIINLWLLWRIRRLERDR